MKVYLIVSLLGFLLCSGTATQATDGVREIEAFSTISTKGMTEAQLTEAIAGLPKSAIESPQYWSRIANDPGYSDFHRRHAATQSFIRHVHAGMKLSKLALLLNRPTWFRAADIAVLTIVGGHIPLNILDLGGTTFVLKVLPETEQNSATIYLYIPETMDAQSFRSLVLDPTKAATSNATVADVGIVEWNPVAREEKIYQNGTERIRKL